MTPTHQGIVIAVQVIETDRGTRLVQTAFFEPKGLPGLAYWYVLYPVHGLIFRGMVRVLAARSLAPAPELDPAPAPTDRESGG